MTRIASRLLLLERAAIAALALAAFSGAAAPAAADCKGPELRPVDTVSLGGSTWKVGYRCYNNCGVQDTSAPVIEEVWLYGSFDMLHCRSRCSARNDCFGVSYHDTVGYVDGREVRIRVCRLYGRGELHTVNTMSPRPIDATVVCIRLRDHTIPWQKHLDLDILQRDQTRPGVPNPGGSIPKRP